MASSSAPSAVLRMRASASVAVVPLASASRPASRATAVADSIAPERPRNARRAWRGDSEANVRNDIVISLGEARPGSGRVRSAERQGHAVPGRLFDQKALTAPKIAL